MNIFVLLNKKQYIYIYILIIGILIIYYNLVSLYMYI